MTATQKPTALDLLSRILELEFGSSRLQHYGLFDEDRWLETEQYGSNSIGGDSVIPGPDHLLLAQRRFEHDLLDTIKQRIGSDASILIAGESLLSLARASASEGLSTIWLGTESLRDEESVPLPQFRPVKGDLPGFSESVQIDLLVLQGSFRYLDQLALLTKCKELLGDNGQLLLFGEFLDDDSRIEHSSLPNLSSFHQLARRLGFKLLENIDLTASAIRTLELVRPLLGKHGQELLLEKLAYSSSLDDLLTEFSRMLQEFVSSRRCFRLFILERGSETKNEWANAEYGDISSFHVAEISDLFEKSFNVPFDKDLWNWKYQQGKGKCVAARLAKGGNIVAHYGGTPRHIMYFGAPSMAIQPCDVMVHPDIRKRYGKGSLFFEVAATFLEREIGNTVNHLLGFGFPNQKTMNISKRLGLYEKTDDFIELEYAPVKDSRAGRDLSCDPFDPEDPVQVNELDDLWLQMSEDYREGIIGVRDFSYIKYRYITHPFARSKQYQCRIIREPGSGKAVAFAVLKEQAAARLLMDLVCSMQDMKPAIAKISQEINSADRTSALKLWVTKSGLEKVWLDDAIVNELGIEIPCNSWNPGPGSKILYGAWWLTAGDMDFV